VLVVALCVQKVWVGTGKGFPNQEQRIELLGTIRIVIDFDKGKPAVKRGRKTKGLGDVAC
jgi:hypothetical protein